MRKGRGGGADAIANNRQDIRQGPAAPSAEGQVAGDERRESLFRRALMLLETDAAWGVVVLAIVGMALALAV